MANFGIEIEFEGLGRYTSEAAERLRGNDFEVRAECYSHSVSNHWKLVTDGSVYNGLELVSPILDFNTDLPTVHNVVCTLREKGASMSDQCGIHVHIDHSWLLSLPTEKRNQYFAFLTAAYQKAEPSFDLLVKENRNANIYCKSTIGKTYRNLLSDRYHKLNLSAFSRHNTVEYRHFQGTLNPDAIVAWIKLVHTFNANVVSRFQAANG